MISKNMVDPHLEEHNYHLEKNI